MSGRGGGGGRGEYYKNKYGRGGGGGRFAGGGGGGGGGRFGGGGGGGGGGNSFQDDHAARPAGGGGPARSSEDLRALLRRIDNMSYPAYRDMASALPTHPLTSPPPTQLTHPPTQNRNTTPGTSIAPALSAWWSIAPNPTPLRPLPACTSSSPPPSPASPPSPTPPPSVPWYVS